ncbi:MAG: InlB B-repeat-containing protein, partial [Clostridia bacterium]|nr:InlB B-repeat-containing protein [Clostridia bacterium]
TVSGTNDAQARTGGIVGQINGVNNQLINCVNNGNITVQTNQSHAGGLVGFAYGETTLTNCSNTGTITGNVTASTPYGIDGKFVGYLVGCGNGVTFNVTFNVEGKETVVSTISGLKPTTSTPTKVDDENYRYSFAGWSLTEGGEVVDLDYVQKDITYYAVFTKTEFYTITFDIDGVTSTAKVLKGNTPTYDQEVTKVGYKFLGWGNDKGEVTGLAVATESTTYYAIFEQVTEKFKVTWVIDGTSSEEEYVYGSTPTHADPTKTDYVFIGWAKTENGEIVDLSKETITEITEYYAVFRHADALTAYEFNEQLTHYGSNSAETGKTRIRTSVAYKMTAGTIFTFKGDSTIYKWAINEMSAPYSVYNYIAKDSGWNTSWTDKLNYSLTQDCYPTIILARIDGATLTDDELYAMKSWFKVDGLKILPKTTSTSGSLSTEEYNSQITSFGSVPWQNTNTRARLTIAIRLRKGAVVTFKGNTSNYNWGVIETNNPTQFVEGAYLDSDWLGTATSYTTKLDGVYLVLTVKKANDAKFERTDVASLHSLFSITATKLGGDTIADIEQVDYEMKSIAHRGACYYAPENTLPAYIKAAKQGF